MRDIKLDFIRGLAMITIAINHFGVMVQELGYGGTKVPTLTAFGFSSAAELFFLLSGYMVGLVYLRKIDFAERLRSRAWKIYQYNFVAFIAAIAVAFVFRDIAAAVSADYTIDNPLMGTLLFAVLGQHPDLLGVLQLYVVLMIVTPAFVWLLRRNVWAAIGASVVIYLAAQVFPWFNLPGGAPQGDWQWNFNPFAWQLLFCLGIVGGERRLHERLTAWLEENALRMLLVIGVFALTAAYYRLAMKGVLPALPNDKETVSVLRVLHAFLTVGFLFSVAILISPWMNTALGRLVATIGQSTLMCYTVSIPVTYLAAGLWLKMGANTVAYLGALTGVLMAVCISAHSRNFKAALPIAR